MKKQIIVIVIVIVIVLVAFLYRNTIKGIWTAVGPVSGDIKELLADPLESPLKLPPGFEIDVFAEVPGARVMVFDEEGNMWVSQTRAGGNVSKLLINEDGDVTDQKIVFEHLQKPHGLAFDPDDPSLIYVAEEHRLIRVDLDARVKSQETILDFPFGGGHDTRTIGFGPDPSSHSRQARRLYISIGSSCNVCHEGDLRRAAILSWGKRGSDVKTVATGLRNAVFFTWSPFDGRMWATEMGRDLLGDDVPPDEINIVEEGKFYGWPTCYGKNVHDIDFDQNTYIRSPCQEPFETPSYIDIPAHSSPLGLAFIEPRFGWPQEYWHDLIVAYHGSWNRTEPTGYKLVRMKLDEAGNYEGTEDFITGWLRRNGDVLGRPAGLLFGPDGTLYVSDDKAGVIYRITY